MRVLALACVVVLNWTYGRLPATPRADGVSFVRTARRPAGSLLGTARQRSAVLLIHGLPGTAEDFNLRHAAAGPAGARSRSTGPGTASPAAATSPSRASSRPVQEVIEKLHLGRPILVGHSYGGAISLAFAERHPGEVRRSRCWWTPRRRARVIGAYARDAGAVRAKAMELPVISQIADVTFSQLLRKVSAEAGDTEAFNPDARRCGAPSHRVLAINMKHGNLEALGGGDAGGERRDRRARPRHFAQIETPAVVDRGRL